MDVAADEEAIAALCATAAALGIGSLRAPLLALRVARAAAALAGRQSVAEADVALAARLVLAPRATILPSDAPPSSPAPEPPAPEPPAPEPPAERATTPSLLARTPRSGRGPGGRRGRHPGRIAGTATKRRPAARTRAWAVGRDGEIRWARPPRRRPARRIRGGQRLNLIETLRAAAPWQRLRDRRGTRIAVRPEDFRVTRFRPRTQTTTVFVVDASGSAALHRLAEAKGAVELLLAECYVRRDRVALLAFRGTGAELLLPPDPFPCARQARVGRFAGRRRDAACGRHRRGPVTRRGGASAGRNAEPRAAHRWPGQHRAGRNGRKGAGGGRRA